MSWNLHVTVAAIAERDNRFLLVEENIGGRLRINQPAGHLESGETLLQAVQREALEETACRFEPEAVVGIYLWRAPDPAHSYLRVAFSGSVGDQDPHLSLDDGIERTLWLTRAEVAARQTQWRSPLVMQCLDDYLAGQRFPLGLLVSLLDHA